MFDSLISASKKFETQNGLISINPNPLVAIEQLVIAESDMKLYPIQTRNIELNKGIQLPHVKEEPMKDEPCVIVGFGPSLLENWELVKQFPTIITCSGAHNFLLSKGIVPTYHAEVDPKETKCQYSYPPHQDVQYVLSDCCHPKLFEQLSGFKVQKFNVHVGFNVGHWATFLATTLGYRDLYFVGMDGSGKWAGPHHNDGVEQMTIQCKGREFVTTEDLLMGVLYFKQFRNVLPSGTTLNFADNGLLATYLED